MLQRIVDEGLELRFEKRMTDLLEKNLDRIEFVRDGIGLRDFLFISQAGIDSSNGFSSPLFLVKDIDVELTDSFEVKEEKYMYNMEFSEEIILKSLKEFFLNTNRTLYIGIGFEENLDFDKSDYSRWTIKSKTTGHPVSYFQRLERLFPTWYAKSSIMPEEARFLTKNAEKYVFEFLKKEQYDILKEKLIEKNKSFIVDLIEKN